MSSVALPGTLVTGALAVIISWIIYALFFHPLYKYPGPRLWAVAHLPLHVSNLRGKLHLRLHQLHQTYGNVVRITPRQLSVIATGTSTWKTIYNHKPNEMIKDPSNFGQGKPYNGVRGMESAPLPDHIRMRKALSPAFSERALRDQQGFINVYIDKLIRLIKHNGPTAAQDLTELLDHLTFDIIGDLAFGESFGGLDSGGSHEFVNTMHDGIRAMPWLQFFLSYNLGFVVHYLLPKKLRAQRDKMKQFAVDRINTRVAKSEDRRDIISYMYKGTDSQSVMSVPEMHTTFTTIIVAGAETTSSLMAGLFYLALAHPPTFHKLCGEIRSTFAETTDITVQAAQQIQYLTCALQETFRLYPPLPASTERIVPGAGEYIDGHWVPGGTNVSITHYCTYHSPNNWAEPDSFVPDRWLPEGKRPAKFDNDHRSSLQPFAVGNRDCIGQNLAWAELRLTICRLLLEFDLSFSEDTTNWLDQCAAPTWIRRPLKVFAKLRSPADDEAVADIVASK